MATFVLGAVGAGLGSAIPGVGIGWGWSIGTTIGAAIDAQHQPGVHQETGKLSDLRYGGSSYGTDIPKCWGKVKLPGSVVWVAKDSNGNHLIQHTKTTSSGGGGSGGGGGSSSTTYWYTASYAVMFMQGSLFVPDDSDPYAGTWVHRNPVLKRLWANDVVIWEAGGSNTVTVRTYSGTHTQTVDSLIAAAEGSNASAFRDMVYVVIEDHDLSNFNSQIPNIVAEIWTDDVVEGDILEDLALERGLQSSDLDLSAANQQVKGLSLASTTTGYDGWAAIASVRPIDYVDVDGKLKVVRRGGANSFSLTDSDLGVKERPNGSGQVFKDPKVKLEFKQTLELPGRINFTYYDVDFDYQQVTQTDVKQTVDVQNTIDLTTSLVMDSDEARSVVLYHMDTAWIERRAFEFSLGPRHLKIVPADVGTLTCNGKTYRIRITKADVADPGELRYNAVLDDDTASVQTLPGGTTTSTTPDTQIAIPSEFIVWSGTELRNEDQSTAGFYVAATSVGTDKEKWRGATVYYSADSGTTWVNGGTVSGKSVFGTATTALGDGTAAKSWEPSSTFHVTVNDDGLDLNTTTETDVLSGQNICVLGNEILGFTTANLTAASQYDISHLYRGIRSSPMTGHTSSDMFVVASSNVVRIPVNSDYIGTSIDVKVVSLYESLSDVTAKSVTIAAPTPTKVDEALARMVVPKSLTPVTVYGSGAAISWTTYDASGDVPVGTTFVMLQCTLGGSGSSARLEFRKDGVSSTLYGPRLDADAGRTTNASGMVIVPLTSGLEFDYRLLDGASSGEVQLIGYFGPA